MSTYYQVMRNDVFHICASLPHLVAVLINSANHQCTYQEETINQLLLIPGLQPFSRRLFRKTMTVPYDSHLSIKIQGVAFS